MSEKRPMTKKCCFKSIFAILALASWFVSAALGETHHLRGALPRQDNQAASATTGRSETLLPDGQVLFVGGEDKDGHVRSTLSVKNPLTGVIAEINSILKYPRAWHTTTVLPDGTVLIFGGLDSSGKIVTTAELFDPSSQTIEPIAALPLSPRAFHSATLLTDGRLLIAGGISGISAMNNALELWDSRKNRSIALSATSSIRRKQIATLLPDGRVLFAGGEDANGKSLSRGELFDPVLESIAPADDPASMLVFPRAITEARASSPEDKTENVPVDALISVRFSRPVQMSSIGERTVAFTGPDGEVLSKIIAAENGMLVFLTPKSPLTPGTSYSVRLSGVIDGKSESVAAAEFIFSTAGQAPVNIGDEDWTPTSDWQTHREPSKFESLPDLKGKKSETALAGKVLKLNGQPLENVTLEILGKRTKTDDTGRFLLKDISPGHQVLVIDARTANTAGKKYGLFEYGAEIQGGMTNSLGFKIWMPALDISHEVTIPSPTAKETVVTSPLIPGLELHLPPNTVITDHDGKVTTRISITPIPLDRTPFPLPFVKVPIYFTIQPGGAYIKVMNAQYKGARLIYPNVENLAAGIPFAFWNYSADQNGWHVYGNGHVTADRSRIVPDPGVVIYEFSGAMVGSGSAGASVQNPGGDLSQGGEPVMLSSGLFVHDKTDLVVDDVIPLILTRTYRPSDSWSRPFGIGATHPYEMFIGGDGSSFGSTPYVDLILPNGSRIHMSGNGPGPSYSSYLNSSAGTPWYGAIISQSPRNPTGYTLPGVWQLQKRDGTIYSFPESIGLINPGCQALVGITDRNGNQVKITRNADANCTISKITSPSGRYIQFTYDTSSRVKTATDNMGRVVQYAYYVSGTLQTVTDANGGVWTYTYDAQNRMITIKDARQIVYLTNEYDSAGRVTKQTQADNSTYLFSWVPTANTTNVSFATFSGGGGSGPGGYEVIAFRGCTGCDEGYLPLVSQVDVTDPNGNVRRVVFNAHGYTTSDTRALGKPEQQVNTYTYFADNLIGTITDQLGRITSFIYDANGNPTQVVHLSGTPNAVTTTASFDGGFSNPLSITDPLNHTVTFGYDTTGNVTTFTDPLGHNTTVVPGANGLPLSVRDALGHTTQFGYDLGDLVSVTDPLSRTSSMFRDASGRVVSQTDPLGHVTQIQYNNLNEVTQVTDPLHGITSFTFDGNGNLLTVQDAKQQGTGTKTVYTYDNMDRLATRKDALLNQESYLYDFNGNLNQFTDRRAKVSKYTYDGLNRTIFVGYGMTAGPVYESTITNTFDGGNRLTKTVDTISGTINRAYDGLNRLTSDATPQGTVAYTYDTAGRRASLTVPGQSVANYTFDNANRLTLITQGATTVQFGYDNANRRTSLTLPNGVAVAYGYDNGSQLTGLTYTKGGTTLGNLTYGYDLNGRRTNVGGSYARTGLPTALSTAVYNANNQLTTWGTTHPTYDLNGNMAGDGTHSYTWDARNHLKQIDVGTTASFVYDPFGRRKSKTISGTTSTLLYDGANAVQETIGANTANSLMGGVDEVFQRTDSSGARSFLADALGSTVALTDSTGAVQTSYTFEPYGNTTTSGSANSNTLAYTGRELDAANLNLYYYRARYYNPALQRFISEDPIGFNGGINMYAYVDNSPTNWIDSNGTDKKKKKCPSVPFHPGDANIDQNIADESSNAPLLPNLFGAPLVLDDFYQKVRNKGPWDYKQDFNLDDSGARVRPSPYEDFGNFNYGATASALGIPENVALRMAGYAGQRAQGHSPLDSARSALGPAPHGDDVADQTQIGLGYDYDRNGCHQ